MRNPHIIFYTVGLTVLTTNCARFLDPTEISEGKSASATVTTSVIVKDKAESGKDQNRAGSSLESISPLQLGVIVARAAKENPEAKSAWHRWQAMAQKHPQEVSLPDPQIEGMIFDPKQDDRWMAGIKQDIPWPGKLILAGQIADEETRIEALGYLAAVRDAIGDAKETFFELYYIDRAEEITGEIEKLYERYAALAAGAGDMGQTKLPELFRAEAQRAQLGYDLIFLREMRQTEEARLRAILGEENPTPLGRTLDVTDPTTATANLRELTRLAETNNQELAQARRTVVKAKTERRLARQAPFPDFMIGVNYTDMVDKSDMPVTNPVGFAVGMSVPLWPRKYRAKAEEAKQMEASAQSDEERERLKLRSDLAEAYFRLNNSFRLVRLYRDTLLPQARQAQQSAEELYGRHEANLAALLETLATVHNFELARLRATADFYQNTARVERLIGTAIPASSEGKP